MITRHAGHWTRKNVYGAMIGGWGVGRGWEGEACQDILTLIPPRKNVRWTDTTMYITFIASYKDLK